ncbi:MULTISPECIES: hypothetical protein [Enterobacter]|uniref:hypothetical protein n=1 Tax=Enterobacter TaxID=547 RepID=UPI000DCB05ED|nr:MULTISPECIES: hypothetical protein [Enterobacter]ELK6770521.1 hypothetical protein [Enterobacter asburiae]MBG0618715.1 hypothetical protein [Enterobacter roggenkampii]RAY84802.1 hypothetical protein DP190_09495 [Enterobacter cloacae]KAA0514386.1 hypothetical protein F0319_00830 [Enterobacter vonholyi]MBG0668281.1 hypothetical protein [Enterobacter roggenkampii]
MLNPGFVTRKALAQWQDVPAFLPQFQFHEKHRTVIHTAHPEHILPLIANFDVRQDVVIRRLMFLRQLPQKFLRNQQANSIGNFGLHSFTLLKNSASELCYGLRGQFWRSNFGLEKVPDVSAFQTSVTPGSATLLLRYQVTELAPGQHELSTETFVYCPDRSTRLRMAAYWLAIRAGSGWIRKRTLKAVRANIESQT